MKTIGLAGKPGCGKSAVSRTLAARPGVDWIDLDPLAWETYRPGTEVHDRLIERFGRGILGCGYEIDRRRLSDRVFSEPTGRTDLDAIVHPAVMRRLREEVDARRARGVEILLVEGAALIHSPYVDRSLFDAIVWLDVSEATRTTRLVAAGRADHAARVPDPHPDSLMGVLKMSAEEPISQVADRLVRLIETIG